MSFEILAKLVSSISLDSVDKKKMKKTVLFEFVRIVVGFQLKEKILLKLRIQII